MRYIDFFEDEDIFSRLVLDVRSGGQSVSGVEMSFATVFRNDALTARLSLNNGALVTRGSQVVSGSILDLDVWLEASGFDVFGDAAERFEEAHQCNNTHSVVHGTELFSIFKSHIMIMLRKQSA